MAEEIAEVFYHSQQLALLIENHKRAAGGKILEADAALERVGCQCRAGGAGNLYGLRVCSAAVCKYLPDRCAERIFVNAGALAVATDTEQLGTGRLFGARSAQPVGAEHRDFCRINKGLDIIDHRGFAEQPLVDRIGRAFARDAALAFQ